MYTIKLPYYLNGPEGHLKYQREFSSCVKSAFNLRRKSPGCKQSGISAQIKSDYNFPNLDASLKEYAVATAFRLNADRTLTFGGKSKWRKFNSGSMTKEEWSVRKHVPLYFRGRKNKYEKGNRKFNLKVIESNSITFKPNRNEHFEFRLPNLNPKIKSELERFQALAESGQLALTIGFNHEFVYITVDEKELVPEDYNYDPVSDRVMSLDLNPNYVGVVVTDHSEKILHKEIISIKDLNDKENKAFRKLRKIPKGERKKLSEQLKIKYSAKRNHEIFEISKYLTELAKHLRCETLGIEKLDMRSKNHGRGRRYNRLLNNQWNREKLYQNLQKRCNLSCIRFQEVAPQYSSFIGQLTNPNEFDMIAAAIELGRRARLFVQKFIKKLDIKSGIIFPALDLRSLADCWNGKLRLTEGLESWKSLYQMIKNSKQSYRVFFDPNKNKDLFFREKSSQSLIRAYRPVEI